jgi:hypothetical protein
MALFLIFYYNTIHTFIFIPALDTILFKHIFQFYVSKSQENNLKKISFIFSSLYLIKLNIFKYNLF